MELQNHLTRQQPNNLHAEPCRITRIIKRSGHVVEFSAEKVHASIARACQGYEQVVSVDIIVQEIMRTIFDGISTSDLEKAYYMAAAAFMERDPAYDKVATRLLLNKLAQEVAETIEADTIPEFLPIQAFIKMIRKGMHLGLLHETMGSYDLEYLAEYLKPERDQLLSYMGLYTLNERYFLKHQGQRLELPQVFWMRIAMGLALNEPDKNNKAVEFYELLSTLRYVPSTPTLFHAGFPRAQLSSCYLNVVQDDLGHIFKCMGDNAQLSKWAGGIGTSWTNIRATGAFIKGIKATSQGVVPYLKIANDVVVAITRSGIRRGGACVYLEVWHFDIEDFLDLRRNTGDERRRTHDLNTANWIPDLFMKRVLEDKQWTLFSPEGVADLAELSGKAFESRYEYYEEQARKGQITLYREISAKQLWRKMLTRLFETGHPWITFKDPCNIRSPQDHAGFIHNSNLCTEITLNTSSEETAVCNLGSINLACHITNTGQLDDSLLKDTITKAVRMLDNIIDLNFYPTVEAQTSNMRHRPVGLGLMGFQDALFKSNISFACEQAREFADQSMEKIAYYAIEASCKLAEERGAYSSYKGSKWDRGIFPLDTIDLLENERGMRIDVSRTARLDWQSLKTRVKQHGMRNSNVMAIAPTATIATIAGCYPSIEPIYKNIYVKSNVSGEFTIVNSYLVEDLKKLGLWNRSMLDMLKYYDGDLASIPTIPNHLKDTYKTAFELDPEWLIKITAARGKWIDQSQSHNVFLKGVSGQKLHDIYLLAWKCGLKTCYYLRTLGASQIEKSTLDAKTFGYTQKRTYTPANESSRTDQIEACSLEGTDCESCQ